MSNHVKHFLSTNDSVRHTSLQCDVTCTLENFLKTVKPRSDYKDSRVEFNFRSLPPSACLTAHWWCLMKFEESLVQISEKRARMKKQNTTYMSGKGIWRFSGGAFGLCSCFFLPEIKKTYTHASLNIQINQVTTRYSSVRSWWFFPRSVAVQICPLPISRSS